MLTAPFASKRSPARYLLDERKKVALFGLEKAEVPRLLGLTQSRDRDLDAVE